MGMARLFWARRRRRFCTWPPAASSRSSAPATRLSSPKRTMKPTWGAGSKRPRAQARRFDSGRRRRRPRARSTRWTPCSTTLLRWSLFRTSRTSSARLLTLRRSCAESEPCLREPLLLSTALRSRRIERSTSGRSASTSTCSRCTK
eukprot:Amastigsp_a7954_14.p4 type:complete len:146 gc:universal Amastigsp_a7954_14:268-705(+)